MIYLLMRSLIELNSSYALVTQEYLSSMELLICLIVAFVFSLASFGVYYTFRCIGLYVMAKNAGYASPKRALIPFLSIKVLNDLMPNGKYVKRNELEKGQNVLVLKKTKESNALFIILTEE